MSAAVKSSARLKNKRRPGDPWISKNRVLNGGTGKSKRNCPIYRNPNFDTDETKLLIQLWGDPKVQRELITTHKKHVVIAQLSAKMEEYGYYRSPEEITTRIKNMKCFYNRLKKELESNKGMDPSWRHYAEMDAIMTRPIFSVRPNEVPAPSLKYLLEQEKEKRSERKRKAEEDGSSVSESDDDICDILAVPTTTSSTSTTATKEGVSKEIDAGGGGESSTEIEFEAEEKSSNKEETPKENRRKSSNEENAQNKNEPEMTEAELAIKLEIESEQFQEYQSIEDETDKTNKTANNKKIDETIKVINITDDDDLLVPKMEPIDVDEVYEKQGKQNPPTSTAKPNFTQLADILKQPAKPQNMPVPPPTMITFSMPNNSSASTTISSVNTSSTGTPSKISVVSPTILMPPLMSTKATMATTNDQRQVRLPGNLHALLAASGSRTTVTNANGMKFLLVNAADQRGPPITTSNLTSTIPITGTNRPNTVPNQTNVKIIQNTTQLQQQQPQQQMASPQLQQQQQFQQKQQQQQQIQQQQQQMPQKTQSSQQQPQQSLLKPREPAKRSDTRQEYREQLKKRDLLGIKTTLLKMLKVQEDANEIQNERLAIERERLQFERSLADRFLNIFEQNQKIQQQMQQQLQQQQLMVQQQQLQQSQQHHIQIQQRPTTATPQVFTTNTAGQSTAVTANGQIMLPPKLLITTMVPTSAAAQAATGSSSSKVLTTTGFKNLPPATSNDIQLVVPKEEPQN